MKTCIRCGEAKPLDHFWNHPKMSDGKQGKCKSCCREYNREWSYNRQNHLRARYGITKEDYTAMLDAQGGVCAICKEACKTGQRLAVDYDHASGVVRGLLCMNCNRAVGHLQNDPALMRAAADYMESYYWRAQNASA